MDNAQINFAVEEYVALWNEYGIEDLSEKKEKVRQFLSEPKAPEAAPAAKPASAPAQTLEGIVEWIGDCKLCKLWESRKKIVIGSGNPRARVMFIGDTPGLEEDGRGIPFVGEAGKLLTKIIEAMGMTRDDVYVTNIIKCRTPEDRPPAEGEIQKCHPFLKAQIERIRPRIVIALGATASRAITGKEGERGKVLPISWIPDVSILTTYHPIHLLTNAAAKKSVWEDMKLALKYLGTKP